LTSERLPAIKNNGTRTVSIASHALGQKIEPAELGTFARLLNYARGPAMLPLAVVFVAGFIIFAWLFDIELFQQPMVGVINTKFNTSLCFMLTGVALLLMRSGKKQAAQLCVVPVVLCATAMACEYAININLGIDQFFVVDNLSGGLPPGRMSPLTIVCFLLSAASLLLKDHKIGRTYPTEILGYLIAMCGLLSLTGYAYEVPTLYSQFSAHVFARTFTVMAFTVSLLFLLIGLSLMSLSQNYWFYKLWTRESHGGEMVRTFLPLSIGLPLGSGYLKSYLESFNLIKEEVAVTLIVLGMIVSFSIVISRLAAKFDKLDEERKAFSREREDLIFALAHDMKVPLIGSDRVLDQIISGRVEDPEMQKEYLGLIRESNEGLLWTIQNILYRYKQETGLDSVTTSLHAIEPLLIASVNQMQPLALAKNLALIYDGSARDVSLDFDEEAVKRILVNLIHNATKFTSAGAIMLSTVQDKQRFLIKVTDTGCGISAEHVGLLFQKGHQTEEGRRYSSGSGLGLHFSRQLMCAHGGDLVVSSSTAEGASGTVFTLIFNL
jgi:signal transduction histidine kinase